MRNIFQLALTFLFPSFCRSCRKPVPDKNIFCSLCEEKIKPLATQTICVTRGFSIPVYSISSYQEPLRRLILQKKYSDRLASRQLGRLICEKTNILEKSFDCIIPVPLHWTRYARRGFNQADEIAHVISKFSGIPVVRLISRKKRTTYQSRLSHEDRQDNVKNCFVIKRKYRDVASMMIYEKRILLVDDLYTTGATLKNVARPIISSKPKEISAVVACRVL